MKRKKMITLITAALLGLGLMATQAAEKKTESKPQTTCPVMGGKINKAQFADVHGKRIYVCCAGCIDKIKNAPMKYIKQLEGQGITLDKTPKKVEPSAGKTKEDHSGHQH